jgi:hypothetical protein
MKKTFVKSMCAAMLAAGLTGCTDEDAAVKEKEGEGAYVEEGVPTYATFKFIINGTASTKASMIEAANESDQVESIRLIIFRTGAKTTCEVNEAYSVSDPKWDNAQSKTVQLTSGTKRIFVIANAEKKDSVRRLLDGVQKDATPLAQFEQLMFDLDSRRTPGAPVTDLKNLSAVGDPLALVFSNGMDKKSLHTLAGGIGMDESRNGGAAQNNIAIDVQRTIAKASVYYKDTKVLGTADSTGTLSDLKFAYKNISSKLYLFQKFASDAVDPQSNTPHSPFYNAPPQSNYAEMFYMGYDLVGMLKETDVNKLKGYYIPENTSETPRNATTTYAAIEGVFLPKAGKIVESCDYNPLTNTFFSVVFNQQPLRTGATLYQLVDVGTAAGLPANIFFLDKTMAYKAAYCIKNGSADGFNPGDNHDDLKWNGTSGYIVEYSNGKCYYRLNLGEGNSSRFVPGVKRNHHYRAEITSFAGIGAPDIDDLNKDPENPIGQLTHVTATITVVQWVGVDSRHEL